SVCSHPPALHSFPTRRSSDLICCKTIIGCGAPNKQGTEATHGAALGEEEVDAARKQLDWPYEPFVIPQEIRRGWDARERGGERRSEEHTSELQSRENLVCRLL